MGGGRGELPDTKRGGGQSTSGPIYEKWGGGGGGGGRAIRVRSITKSGGGGGGSLAPSLICIRNIQSGDIFLSCPTSGGMQ